MWYVKLKGKKDGYVSHRQISGLKERLKETGQRGHYVEGSFPFNKHVISDSDSEFLIQEICIAVVYAGLICVREKRTSQLIFTADFYMQVISIS